MKINFLKWVLSMLTYNSGIRGPPAEFLRTQSQKILTKLMRQSSTQSRDYLRNMVKTTPLHELMEFFHAFVGFCIDPSSLLSPLSEYHVYQLLIIPLYFFE